MRLAIAVTCGAVAEHFGHCDFFAVYDIVDNKVINIDKICNPPHQKGFLPTFLKEQEIDILVAGNMGEMAVKGLEELGIKTFRGVSGNVDDVIKCYLNGTLKSNNQVCKEHQHQHH